MTKYTRYRTGSASSYGILDGESIREIAGDLFGGRSETGATHRLADVKLLYPCQPTKILCVGLNYKSHLGGRPQPSQPEIFYKPLSALQDPGGPIAIPRDAIFGVTCGNDVSERNWQHGPGKDLQWWRAKGSDTFAPFGPAIVTGIDYSNLLLTTRLNGEVVQQQYTSDLIFDCPAIVSWISGWVTLMPGDVIYTGTPGNTRKMAKGHVVQVEIQDIGVLENPVA